ncbi:MAG: bifunctional 3-5 exonuclease/DNA polymerase [Micrococcaceae bacterium]|nr:bifunctional 3-5 exonuclease/DNA polymerase [Micrococcaceae bacterium]
MYVLLASAPEQRQASGEQFVQLLPLDASGAPAAPARIEAKLELAAVVAQWEKEASPRWVWHRTQDWYPQLLAAGVSVDRCHDLLLCRNILVSSQATSASAYARGNEPIPVETAEASLPERADQGSLFDQPLRQSQPTAEELVADLQGQLEAVSGSLHPGRLALLLAAESAGALSAAEMQHTGLPWREDLHQAILSDALGPRPSGFQRPDKLEALAAELRNQLNAPSLNPDSPQELMRALHRAGIEVRTTRSWELQQLQHPAIAPLLAYKKLSRLHTANGWTWLDQWVHGGRFRPEYVVGGVVSGRWASRGGGALQIPKNIRGAAHAEKGWKLVVADASQLEPRVLVALARDTGMAAAARDKDLYAGIAAQGFGGDRAKAKVALLGAIYGATTGESGRLMPQLAKTYPRAVAFVEEAARAGERGDIVSTRLGRSCPPPSRRWLAGQRTTTAEEQRRADAEARSRGRFTRNFVVQGSAADWAACWLAELRRRLRFLGAAVEAGAGSGERGGPETDGKSVPELVFFLHDEVMVHTPESQVALVRQLIEESARAATALLFGEIPVEFPVSITVVDSYADAK